MSSVSTAANAELVSEDAAVELVRVLLLALDVALLLPCRALSISLSAEVRSDRPWPRPAADVLVEAPWLLCREVSAAKVVDEN